MELWKAFAKLLGQHYSTFIVFVVSSCLFLSSMTVAWTSPVLVKLVGDQDNPLGRSITKGESDLLGSLLFMGAAIGPLLFIGSVEEFGRKRTLLLSALILPLTFGTLAFAKRIEIYFICRLLIGLNFGVTCSVQPVYVSELCTAKNRSVLMSFSTCFLILGNLASYALGHFLSLFQFNSVIAIISLVFISIVAICCPESPYHIMRVGGKQKAGDALRNIRQITDIDKELLEIIDSIENEVRTSYLEIFKSMQNFKPFVIATVLLLLQHLSGMIVLITYSQQIFMETNVPLSPYNCSIIMTVLQLVTSFLTPVLLKCNTFSRKTLLMFTFFGLAACNLSISGYFHFGKGFIDLNWLPLVIIMMFVTVYNCGLDPIPWMLVGEIYPLNIKSVGSALSTTLFFLSSFPLLYSFNKFSIQFIFLVCGFFNIFGFFYVNYMIVDTEGKTLRQIHKGFLHPTDA